MKKIIGLAILVGLIIYTTGMWVTAEHDLSKTKEDQAELQTDFDMLESSFNAQDQQLKDTGKDLAEKMQTISDLQRDQEEQQDKIADLERQLKSARASRSQRGPRLITSVGMSADFWRHLSNCECPSGQCENSGGFFQFKADTPKKVGYVPGQPYDVQLAEAKDWAGRIHPNENTTSGWPICWDRALREIGGG